MITETIKRNGRTQAIIGFNDDNGLVKVELWNEELSEYIPVDIHSLFRTKNTKLYSLVLTMINSRMEKN
jgi:hypothetical protein